MENNLLFDYGPIWNRRERYIDKRFMDYQMFPHPGGVTSGPIITEKSIILNGGLQNDNLEEMGEQREVKSIEVKNRNYIAKKFPLKFDPCLTPVEDAASRLVLPGSLGKRFHHSSILSSYKLNNDNHLVYGQPDQDSCTLKIACVSQKGKDIKLDNVRKIINCKKILKSDAAVFHGTPQVLLLVDNGFKFIKVNEEAFDLCSIRESNIFDCCLSRDINSRFAYVRQDGTLNVFNVDEGKNTWSGEFDVSLRSGEEYTECEFGYNPSYVNVACDSEVFLVDTRLPANYNGNLSIFSVKEMSEYLRGKKEYVCGMKCVPNLPFVYVSCSDTLLLMDSRQCKYPVLTWSHMMRGRSSFSQCFRDCDIDYHIMADPLKSQLCVTASISDNAEYPSISSLSTPRHLNVINDTFAVARNHDLWYTVNIEEQMCCEMVGLTVLPMEIGNVICLQNNYGNLFSLNAVNKKGKSNSSDNSSLKKSLKNFEKSLFRPLGTNKKSEVKIQDVKFTEGLRIRQCFTYKGKSIQHDKNRDKVVWNINSISKLKNYSKFYTHNKLNEAKKTVLSYFAVDDQAALNDEFIESHSDALSEMFLSVWNEDGKQNNSQFKKGKRKKSVKDYRILPPYNSTPNFLNSNVSHPLLSSTNEIDKDADAKDSENATSTSNANNEVNMTNNNNRSVSASNEINTTINDSYDSSCNTLLMNNSVADNTKKIKTKKRKSCADGF